MTNPFKKNDVKNQGTSSRLSSNRQIKNVPQDSPKGGSKVSRLVRRNLKTNPYAENTQKPFRGSAKVASPKKRPDNSSDKQPFEVLPEKSVKMTPKLEKMLEEAEADIAAGRVLGPFSNAEDAIAALKDEVGD